VRLFFFCLFNVFEKNCDGDQTGHKFMLLPLVIKAVVGFLFLFHSGGGSIDGVGGCRFFLLPELSFLLRLLFLKGGGREFGLIILSTYARGWWRS